MSARVSDSIGRLFKELEEEDEQGIFNKEEKRQLLANLHGNTVAPENVSYKDVDSYLNVISINDIEQLRATLTLEAKQREKEKEEHNKKLNEANKKRNDALKILESAAIQIQESRNEEIQTKYEEELIEYKRYMTMSCDKRKRGMWCKSLLVVLLYVVGVVAIILLASKCLEIEFWGVRLSNVAPWIITALAFVPPLYKNTTIASSFAFCFKPNRRSSWKENIFAEYKRDHPEPQLHLCAKEEVMEELVARASQK